MTLLLLLLLLPRCLWVLSSTLWTAGGQIFLLRLPQAHKGFSIEALHLVSSRHRVASCARASISVRGVSSASGAWS